MLCDTPTYSFLRTCLTMMVLMVLGISSAWSSTPDEQSARLDKAFEFIETGKPDSAAVLLYDLPERFEKPEDRVRVFYYLALAMNQLGRLGEEIQFLIMAREELPEAELADRVNLAYSRILYNTGNFEDCISIAEEFRAAYPDSPLMPDMLYIAGNAYYAQKRYQRAFNTYSDITRDFEGTERAVESIMKEGLCLYNLDLIGGAIERFELYLASTDNGENLPDALYYLGKCHENTGQSGRAADILGRLSIEYPFYPGILELYLELGDLYIETGRYAEAQNVLLNYTANADTTHADYFQALLNLERIAYRQGIYSSEIEIYEHYAVKYPESPLTPAMFFNLARYHTLKGNLDEAFEKYLILMTNPLYSANEDSAAFLMADTYASLDMKNEAVEFLKNRGRTISAGERIQRYTLKLGTLFEEWEQYETAVAWYDSCHALHASQNMSVEALMGIGRIFRALDRWMDAGKIYERIIADYPKYPYIKEVYLSLSEIYHLEGRLKSAALAAEKAVKYADDSEKSGILLTIADLYAEIDEDHAFRLYQLIFDNGNNPSRVVSEALVKYGDLARREGDRESAIKAYATVIEIGIDSVWVAKAREKLDRIKAAQ